MKRKKRKVRRRRKLDVNEEKVYNKRRQGGYYWIKVANPNGNTKWIIAKWWKDYKFWDTFGTIPEMGRREKIVDVDETIIEQPIRRRRRKQ